MLTLMDTPTLTRNKVVPHAQSVSCQSYLVEKVAVCDERFDEDTVENLLRDVRQLQFTNVDLKACMAKRLDKCQP